MDNYNPKQAIEAQASYCKENHVPHFAPYGGICFSCGRNIYSESTKIIYRNNVPEEVKSSGITVERADRDLITGCPHCHRTYCD